MKEVYVKEDAGVSGAKNALKSIVIVLGVITFVAAIAFAVYKYLTPDYLDDFDEFDDDFDDDFFEDDQEIDEDIQNEAEAEADAE